MRRRAFIKYGSLAATTAVVGAAGYQSEAESTRSVLVSTPLGRLEGQEIGGIQRFLGVPYAVPPTGEFRWQAPQPPNRWMGTRKATTFGHAAIQTFRAGSDLRASESEDCLYLNVWNPSSEPNLRKPVMMWIHGGGNLWGAGSLPLYDGADLANEGVTVVTINYRLGAFGFLAHPDSGANFAVQDWVAALRWIASNIESFGGDPDNVTIFGQSAGAVAVRTLLSTPSANGLFHRAIIQSAGFEEYAFAATPSYTRVEHASKKLLDLVSADSVHDAKSVSAEKVRSASLEFSGIVPPEGEVHTPANLVWYPVVDNEIVLDEFAGWKSDVPVMLGCVENEARYFIKPDGEYTSETLEHMSRALGGKRANDVLSYFNDSATPVYEALDKLYSAAIWFEPALATLKRFDKISRSIFYYHFNRASPGAVERNSLADHAVENPYVFGNLEPGNEYDEVDRYVSNQIQHAWVNFAKGGTPKSLDGSEWPRYQAKNSRMTLIQDTVAYTDLQVSPITRILHGLR